MGYHFPSVMMTQYWQTTDSKSATMKTETLEKQISKKPNML